MKKAASLFLVLILVFISVSCSSPEKKITVSDLINKSFACNMSLTAGKLESTGKLIKDSGRISYTLFTPETLSGITLSGGDGKVTVSVGSFGISADTDFLPTSSVGNIFDLFCDGNSEIVIGKESVLLNRHTAVGDITAEFDKKALLPLCVYDSTKTFRADFSDFSEYPSQDEGQNNTISIK